MEKTPQSIVTRAFNKVSEIRQSLTVGCITRENLEKLLNDKNRSHRLLKAAKVPIDISVFQESLKALDSYHNAASTLFHNLSPCIQG